MSTGTLTQKDDMGVPSSRAMMAMTPQNFHPLHNEATIAVTPDGLRAFFAATGHEAEEVDFDALEALSAAD